MLIYYLYINLILIYFYYILGFVIKQTFQDIFIFQSLLRLFSALND